jgi:hypothetical protein
VIAQFKRVVVVALCCTTLIVLVFSCRASADNTVEATVIGAQGKIFVERAGEVGYAAIGSQGILHPGDIVRASANSYASILFADGSQTKLSPNAEIRISDGATSGSSQNIFQAIVGVIWAHVRPNDSIETPTANIIVRGSDVLIIVLPASTRLIVISGEALIITNKGSEDLFEGEQSFEKNGGLPSFPTGANIKSFTSWISKAFIISPKSVVIIIIQGQKLFAKGLYKGAAIKYEDVIAYSPHLALAYQLLGDVYERLGKYKIAAEEYELALRIGPKTPLLYRELAKALMGEKQYKLAQLALKDANELQYLKNLEYAQYLKDKNKKNKHKLPEEIANQIITQIPNELQILLIIPDEGKGVSKVGAYQQLYNSGFDQPYTLDIQSFDDVRIFYISPYSFLTGAIGGASIYGNLNNNGGGSHPNVGSAPEIGTINVLALGTVVIAGMWIYLRRKKRVSND